ncbi:hypothetical protein NDI39_16135, partial [Microcoleus sp. ZQ-A2]|nr:hypothetical protein [Microcoleus sp. FACHB-1]
RPMDLACGTNGEMISHSASAISLGYAFRVIVEELQLLDLFLFSNDALDRFRPLYISLETASKPAQVTIIKKNLMEVRAPDLLAATGACNSLAFASDRSVGTSNRTQL